MSNAVDSKCEGIQCSNDMECLNKVCYKGLCNKNGEEKPPGPNPGDDSNKDNKNLTFILLAVGLPILIVILIILCVVRTCILKRRKKL